MNQSDDSDSRAKVDGEGLPWWCRGPDRVLSVQRRVASIPRQGTKIPHGADKKEKEKKMDGWSSTEPSVQRKELWGDWCCPAAGRDAFGGRHVHRTEAGDPLVGEALRGYKKLLGWVGDWKSLWLPDSVTS